MAGPMTLAAVRSQLAGWGVKQREHLVPGRPGAFAPIGIMVHHTAGSDGPAGDAADERVLTQGRPDLPAPLCHYGLTDDGTAVIISTGRANHAGRGDGSVADRIRSGRTAGVRPGADDTDGNALFIGIEVMYSGTRPMGLAQRRGLIKLLAALCDEYGWDPMVRVIGHREWTTRKVDPFDSMTLIRQEAAAALRAGAAVSRETQEDEMALTDDDLAQVRAAARSGARDFFVAADTDTRDIGDGAASPPLRMLQKAAEHAYWARFAGIPNVVSMVAAGLDVDEEALAASLAPLLTAGVVKTWTAEELAQVAQVVNDEADRRERERLGSGPAAP